MGLARGRAVSSPVSGRGKSGEGGKASHTCIRPIGAEVRLARRRPTIAPNVHILCALRAGNCGADIARGRCRPRPLSVTSQILVIMAQGSALGYGSAGLTAPVDGMRPSQAGVRWESRSRRRLLVSPGFAAGGLARSTWRVTRHSISVELDDSRSASSGVDEQGVVRRLP